MDQPMNQMNSVDRLKKKRKQEMLQQLLTQPIQGEHYINGKSINWRSLLLKWIIDNQKDEIIKFEFKQIKQKLEQNGVSFNQKDSLVEYTFRGYIQLYCKLAHQHFKSTIKFEG